VHDHIHKWSCWKLEESPHDVPHYIVAPRLLHDYYKRAGVEANAKEARVQHEVVEDMEGLAE
jgi:hypothetical protein